MFGRDPPDDRVKFGLRLLQSHRRFQPPDGLQKAQATLDQVFSARGRERDPHIKAFEKLEIRRHYADDGEAGVVELDRLVGLHGRFQRRLISAVVERDHLSDQVLVGVEAPLPQAVTDYRDRSHARTIFVRREGAPDQRLYAERREEICRDPGAVNLLRHAPPGQRIVEAVNRGRHRRQMFKDPILTPPVIELRDGYFDELVFGRLIALPRDDQPLLIPERERAQERRIGHAEYGRVRAYAQAERERGDQREAAIFQQHSQTETQVLKHFPSNHPVTIMASFSLAARFQAMCTKGQAVNPVVTRPSDLPSSPGAPADNMPATRRTKAIRRQRRRSPDRWPSRHTTNSTTRGREPARRSAR